MSIPHDPAAPRHAVQPRPESERSIGELMGDVGRDLSTLLRQELELAKAELRQSATQAGRGAGLLASAGAAAVMTLLFASIALWWGLGQLVGNVWSAVIVALLWALIAAVLALTGRRELTQVRGLPQTAETMEKIPNALKGKEEENR